jgi:nucleoid DNA-binding protein
MTGLIYGVVAVALNALAKAFASICARTGYTTFAARIALPALLTNPWFILAISVGVPALTRLIQALKTKKTEEIKEEEKKLELDASEKKVCEAVESVIEKSADCRLNDFGVFNLNEQSQKNIINKLESNYPDKILGLCCRNDRWVCFWANKKLNEKEEELVEKIDRWIRFFVDDCCYNVHEEGQLDIIDSVIHLQVKYPELIFSLPMNNYDYASKKTSALIKWERVQTV